jgi:glycosyltransferase involved in cell wall biosynthesis
VRVPAFRARAQADYIDNPRVTLSMVVRNEASRWLKQTLRAARPVIDDAVVIDDASTDDTVAVVERELAGLPLSLHRNESPRFANEIDLRRQQWDACVATNPDWLLILDADEVLEEKAAKVVPDIVRRASFSAWGFHLHDMWSETHYREDEHWSAHKEARAFLVRYHPDYLYLWNETAQHCGRMPASATSALPSAAVNVRIKHMGWSTQADRYAKYDRYRHLDPEARHGDAAQYASILDANPRLVEWQERSLSVFG